MCKTGVTCIFTCSTHFYIITVKGCSFVEGRMRNCIFCPLSLSVIFIVLLPACIYRRVQSKRFLIIVNLGSISTLTRMISRRSSFVVFSSTESTRTRTRRTPTDHACQRTQLPMLTTIRFAWTDTCYAIQGSALKGRRP